MGTTGWGGPKYNLTGIPGVTFFNYELVPSSFHNHPGELYYTVGENPLWAEPNEADVKKFMIDALKETYNKTTARKASKMILDRFSYKNVAQRVKEALCTIK